MDLSTLLGGIGSFFLSWRKESREEKKEMQAKIEEQRINRPEFYITAMKDFFYYHGNCIDSNRCDMEVFVTSISGIIVKEGDVFAEYDDSILDKKTWICKQFTLKNVGKTVVYEIHVVSHYKKDTCIFNAKTIDEKVINYGILNYSILLDKRIAPGESFTLSLCYNKDKIITGPLTAILRICMRDDNGTYWSQPFFAPQDKLYESRKITYQEHIDDILPDKAIECFRRPYLW